MVIVIVIISTLAAVVVLTFSDFMRKSNQGFTKGSLASLRSALRIYYADTDGVYPTDLHSMTIGHRFLKEIPRTKIPPYHDPNQQVVTLGDVLLPSDTGGWLYGNVPGSSNFGRLLVDCTHTDTRGSAWTSY